MKYEGTTVTLPESSCLEQLHKLSTSEIDKEIPQSLSDMRFDRTGHFLQFKDDKFASKCTPE